MSRVSESDQLTEPIRQSRLQTSLHHDGQNWCTVQAPAIPHRIKTKDEVWAHVREIARGGHGIVHLETKKTTDKHPAPCRVVKSIKVLESELRKRRSYYIRELEAVAKFSLPKYSGFFLQFYGWWDTPGWLHITMEYCKFGDLGSYLKNTQQCPGGRLPEVQVYDIASQVLGGLSLMHSENFAHRDLKPANILIDARPPDQWSIKLCDFGLTKPIDQTVTLAIRGTPGFLPPELLGYTADSKSADPRLGDIWCLGELIFLMLTGKLSGYCDIKSQTLRDSQASELVIEFIIALMQTEPEKRPSAQKASAHPWIRKESGLQALEGLGQEAKDNPKLSPDVPFWLQSEPIPPIPEPSAQWTDTVIQHPTVPSDTRLWMKDSPISGGIPTTDGQPAVGAPTAGDTVSSTPYPGPSMRLSTLDETVTQLIVPLPPKTPNPDQSTSVPSTFKRHPSRQALVVISDPPHRTQRFENLNMTGSQVKFSLDGSLLVSSCWKKAIILGADQNGNFKPQQELSGPIDEVEIIGFSNHQYLLTYRPASSSLITWKINDRGQFQEAQRTKLPQFPQTRISGNGNFFSIMNPHGGNLHIWEVDSEGRFNQIQTIRESHSSGRRKLIWSPNGQHFAFTTNTTTQETTELYTYNEGYFSRSEITISHRGTPCALSPDGQWLATFSGLQEEIHLNKMDPEGSWKQIQRFSSSIAPLFVRPVFSSDSMKFATVVVQPCIPSPLTIWGKSAHSPDTWVKLRLLELDSPMVGSFDFSSNGRRFAISYVLASSSQPNSASKPVLEIYDI